MSNKRFQVRVQRTYTTFLIVEAPSKEYIDDVIVIQGYCLIILSHNYLILVHY